MPALTRLSDADLADRSAAFDDMAGGGAGAEDVALAVLAWGAETFGDGMCVTTSMTDGVLVDLVQRVDPSIEIVFVDTDEHFDETWDTVHEVLRRYRPALRIVSAGLPRDERWRTDPDACCAARKVAPLERVLAEREAWVAGVRRADGPTRASTAHVRRDRRGLVKLAPLAAWSDADVASYVLRRDVPVNVLVSQGFPSVGCRPCTARPVDGDPRSGRWAGTGKVECGLHLP